MNESSERGADRWSSDDGAMHDNAAAADDDDVDDDVVDDEDDDEILFFIDVESSCVAMTGYSLRTISIGPLSGFVEPLSVFKLF